MKIKWLPFLNRKNRGKDLARQKRQNHIVTNKLYLFCKKALHLQLFHTLMILRETIPKLVVFKKNRRLPTETPEATCYKNFGSFQYP